MGVVLPPKWAWLQNFARNCTIGTPLHENLDPPLHYAAYIPGGGGGLVAMDVHVTIFLQLFGKTYTLASPASAVTFIATDSRLLLQDKPKN